MPNIRTQIGEYEKFLNWEGLENTTNPYSHPYSYDPYVVFKINHKYEHCVYSDRLYQWDWKKYDNLCQKYFKNTSQLWDQRRSVDIELFLKDYYNKPELKLIGIMCGCNVSSGHPYWIFMFNCKF